MPTYPHHPRNYQYWILGIIVIVAIVFRFNDIKTVPPGLYPDEAMNGNNAIHALETGEYKVFYPENNGREGLFINLQAQSIKFFGNTPWALRVVSAIFGTLTVLGLFFLTRKLFNWQIAAMASFLMAVSFWHVLFSRIGFRAIMAPFFLVWGLYFLWQGKTTLKLVPFGLSGLFLGLGFYSYLAYRVTPLIVVITLLAYWHTLRKDFSHEKYLHTRNQLLRGLALLMLVAIFVALPLGWHYFLHPADFFGRTTQVSIFEAQYPVVDFFRNTGVTLSMFNGVGDWNWRHNFAGHPLLFWPVGILFAIGLLRSIWKLFHRNRSHHHLPSVQVLLLTWFILGLLPVILSNEGLPHALRAILVAPVVFIFAGEGLWWLYDFCKKWYHVRDVHEIALHNRSTPESTAIATLAILVLLGAIMLNEYKRYFTDWAGRPEVADAYSQDFVALGQELNAIPISQKKYVVVNADGALVNGIPMPAQTVMYITDTWTPEKQRAKNLYYLTKEQFYAKQYDPKNARIFYLISNP